jgi:hypothetical protein
LRELHVTEQSKKLGELELFAQTTLEAVLAAGGLIEAGYIRASRKTFSARRRQALIA